MEPWETDWKDYYQAFEVSPQTEPSLIRAAYRRLSQIHHPDKDHSPGATARSAALNVAYEILSNPLRRAAYDKAYVARTNSRRQDVRRQQEARRQDEVRRQQETRRQDEVRRQEEVRRQQEARRQEEVRRQQEARRREEVRRQQEARRQREQVSRPRAFNAAEKTQPRSRAGPLNTGDFVHHRELGKGVVVQSRMTPDGDEEVLVGFIGRSRVTKVLRSSSDLEILS